MTISLDAGAITLSGACGVEEAEPLMSYLESRPDLPVDISAATVIHTALWQALMVFGPEIIGTPISSFMADKLLPGVRADIATRREI
ncbi:hypothetical protein KX729_27135 [Rhizobium sp. XQZ8]|uniref:hypothetical protein n=1 Tax=Rhizobium populisoli TaxID=2859785 RepID=UPI001CA5948D|nr:hypothetical protein [Rhizobium populisoli]MBW6425124.1 hypothetical protein [Rhizobium populisoli]